MKVVWRVILSISVILGLRAQLQPKSNIISGEGAHSFDYNQLDSPGKLFCREKYGGGSQYVNQDGTHTKIKVDILGETLKKHIQELRRTANRKVDLIFLVDASGSVGLANFKNELKFVKKLLADFTVDRHTTRVAVITFSSKSFVIRGIDHMTAPSSDHHKCSLLEEELPRISNNYTGGSTHTLGAVLEAKEVLKYSRPDSMKAVFLITDGYSNGGNPIPAARDITDGDVQMFTFGIRNGNCSELYEMASSPKDEHLYILDSFDEFEALARRALHEDIKVGTYLIQTNERCNTLCRHGGEGCCDQMAHCSCGTHTGIYECVCRAGYYGNGMRNSCIACPPGTFKSDPGPGDESSCISCPDVQHVSPPGSSSILQCRCSPGFRSVGVHTCAAVRCPELSPPEHGRFVNEPCDNVLHSACGIVCDQGYQLVGTSLKQCQEDGSWTGQATKCELRHCAPLRRPHHGTILCTKLDFSFGTTCSFSCEDGYQLIGSRTRHCLPNSYWSHLRASCKEITCSRLPALEFGRVKPRSCIKEKSRFGSKCEYACPLGYQLVGPHSRLCGSDGSWTPKQSTSNRCVDVQPPIITCPRDQMTVTDPEEATALVSWKVPSAIDNSLTARPTVTIIPAMVPPVLLPIGSTVITYIAEDDSKNRVLCNFYITVRDTQAPRVDKCISPPPFVKKHGDAVVKWEEPVFSDNSGEPVKIKRSNKQGVFPLGTTPVSYTATDNYGNNSTCTIHITVQEHACANPPAPYNGDIQCEPLFNGMRCSLKCHPGYGFAIPPASSYFCDFDSGNWLPADKFPFPDCSESRLSNEVTQFSRLTFGVDTTCEDHFLLNQVETNFRRKLNNKILQYCSPYANCSMLRVNAECLFDNGVNDIPNAIPSFINDLNVDRSRGWRAYTVRNRLRRVARDLIADIDRSSTDIPPTEGNTVQLSFELHGRAKRIEASMDGPSQTELRSRITNVLDSLKRDAETGELKSLIPDQSLKFLEMEVLDDVPRFVCKQGSVIVENTTCVNCPGGTYFNVISEECESCDKGTYQEVGGQLTCLVCPSNTSTTSNNSRSKDDCKGQCLPGSFSASGLEGCETCEIGQYQPLYAQNACLQCPDNTTTWRRGTRKVQDCGVMCREGYVSKTGLEPCFPCPRGYFQPDRGKASCFLCPGKVATSHPGSTKLTDCDGITESVALKYNSIPTSELVINECFKLPCNNSATCESLKVGYTCHCLSGWTGLHCELEIDECQSTPCKNNGTCIDLLDDFNCTCPSGFIGDLCDVEVDECESSPCLNNGTCENLNGAFICHCVDGFNGTQCEIDEDDCEENQCKNGGTCLDQVASFSCACPAGYSGSLCQTDIDECASSPCLNEGTCQDDINFYSCQCSAGYNGERCETEVDECVSSPCFQGATCVNLVAAFTCLCPPAYSGNLCQTKLNSSFDLMFGAEHVSTTDYIALDGALPNLTAVTLAFWMITWDSEGSPKYHGTPFSYANHLYDNALTITEYSGFAVYVNNQSVVTDVTATGNKWHHICMVWSSREGAYRVYKDGKLIQEGKELAKGQTIQGGGFLVIGQEQDKRGGQFSLLEAFIGKLSKLSLWDRILSHREIIELASDCTERIGNVLAWPDFLAGIHGSIEISDSEICEACPEPRNVDNSYVSWNSTEVGSLAIYSCAPGYVIGATDTITCGMGSVWVGEKPLCTKRSCQKPSGIAHGVYSRVNGILWDPEYWVDDVIEYHCKEGYILEGSATSNCTTSGTWSSSPPRCLEINCEPPNGVSTHLIISGEKNPYIPGDTLGFTCAQGHTLYGPLTMTCLLDGSWNTGLPTCGEVQCYNPPVVANGLVERHEPFKIDDKVDYQCHEGYSLNENNSTVICGHDGNWTGSIPICDKIRCPEPLPFRNGTVEGETFTFGEEVTFRCDNGFQLQGKSQVACTINGTWDEEAPLCIPKECPSPVGLPYLEVAFTTITFTSSVVYHCAAGFNLIGQNTRVCQANATWNGTLPTCVPVSCAKPPSVKNGIVKGVNFTYQANISYSCDPGFIIQGKHEAHCNSHGLWDPSVPPSCEPRACEEPVAPENGFVEGTSYKYQDEIKYVCNNGYKLFGLEMSICLANGRWSGLARWGRKCKRIECSEPTPIKYGSYISQGPYYSDMTIRFGCEKGYEVNGKDTRTCRADSTWTGPHPSCLPVKCTKPGKVNNGKYVLQDTSYGSVIEYQCDQGYKINGPEKRTCSEDKEWTEGDPECLEENCPTPGLFEHGTIYGERYSVGNRITYKCEPGYVLNGANERTCTAEQKWSEEAPVCVRIECEQPSDVISNGRMIGGNFTYGSTIYYECDEGYYIDGPTERTCGVGGLWESPIPLCERVQCPPPERPANSLLDGYDYRYGKKITFRCKRGYAMSGGDAQSVCLSNQTWSGTIPTCSRVECRILDDINNGTVRMQGIFYNNRATYFCDYGFNMIGNNIRTCQIDKQWSGQPPVCEQVTCASPPVASHAIAIHKTSVVDQFPEYECIIGYRLTEESTIVCTNEGVYAGDGPVCIKIECPEVKVPADGFLQDTSGNGFDDTVTFSCKEDYRLIGDAVLRCGRDGDWEGRVPYCIKYVCQVPSPVRNGSVLTPDGLRVGSWALYSCDEGFRLHGQPNRTCTHDMIWSGAKPLCEAVECTTPIVEHGSVTLSKNQENGLNVNTFIYGMRIDVSCELGFVPSKSGESIRCEANGTWSSDVPSCNRVICPVQEVDHAVFDKDLIFYYGHTISYYCENGFELSENLDATCSQSGSWSKSLPACRAVSCPGPQHFGGQVVVLETPNVGLGYPFGIRLGFDCDSRSELVGTSEIRCQADKTWSDEFPICVVRTCPLPSDEAASNVAQYKKDNYTDGDMIHFFCPTGMVMVGPSSLLCMEDYVWNGTFPECTIVKCIVPEIGLGLVVSAQVVDAGQEVTSSCKDGYELSGNPVSICQTDATWSPEIASCKAIMCPEWNIQNGHFEFRGDQRDFSYSAQITFSCDSGYVLNGERSIVCLMNGTWTADWPTCQQVSCPDIAQEGLLVESGPLGRPFVYGMQISVACNGTYELKDPGALTLMTCLRTGKWSRKIPECQPRLCPMPNIFYSSSMANGETLTSPDQLTIGTFLEITCDQGYFLVGGQYLICDLPKLWSEDFPRCDPVSCPDLNISHAILNTQNFTYGSSVSVTCELGFELFGDYQVSCLSTGAWSGVIPSCHIIKCPSPAINHGSFQRSGSTAGVFMFLDSVRFVCHDGFDLVGEREIVCQPNSTWSFPPPKCLRKLCLAPPATIDRGTIEVISPKGFQVEMNNTFQTTLKFKCRIGYELSGGDTVDCLANQQWSSEFPTCVKIYCPEPILLNGYIKPNRIDGYTFGNSVRFICNKGFERMGESELFCQPNKEWTYAFPTCERINCAMPGPVEHGRIIGDSHQYEDWITYKCDLGYRLEGPNAAKCLANGNWSSYPACHHVTCPRTHIIPHGGYSSTGYMYNDTVSYSCQLGYNLVGLSKRTCGGDGRWSGGLPRCELVICPPLPEVINGAYQTDSHIYLSRAELLCDQGYALLGEHAVYCTASGNWSDTTGSCSIISCGPPPMAEHSKIIGLRYTYLSVVQYVCESGFELRGFSTRQCEASGFWAGETPNCDRVQCLSPPEIKNALVPSFLSYNASGDNGRLTPPWLFEDAVIYTCTQGYHTEGDGSVSCLADGSWGPRLPSCQRVTCAPLSLQSIPNSHMSFTGREVFEDSFVVICKEGYESTGTPKITCSWNGEWNVSGVECTIITCPQPMSISNGRLTASSLTFNSSVHYTCETGYDLIGAAGGRCLHTRTWSGKPPTCQIISCPQPSIVANGYVRGTDFHYQSVIRYICNQGYQRSGDPLRKCQADKQWSGSAAICNIVRCHTPRYVANGRVKYDALIYGSLSHYVCDLGFEVYGATNRTCEATGEWTGEDPVCAKVKCPSPLQLPHGFYSGEDFTFGALIKYQCNSPYEILGVATRRCQAGKTWSGTLPTCKLKQCQEDPYIDDGYVVGSNYSAGSSVRFVCNEGYQLIGEENVSCVEGILWGAAFPICEKVSCGLPKLIANAVIDGNSYEYLDVVTYRCKRGYQVEGEPEITCRADGHWSQVKAQCMPISCGPPPPVDNSIVTGPRFEFGDYVYYSCRNGFDLHGNNLLQCESDGRWVGMLPRCDMVVCGDVPVISHATTTVSHLGFGSRAIYECNVGYSLKGHAIVECMEDGVWTFENSQPPVCAAIDCGEPPSTQNGRFTSPNTTYESVAIYYCDEGYRLRGATRLKCRHDGVWDGDIPRCYPVVCPPPSPPANGEVSGVSHSYLSIVQFRCVNGYRLVGGDDRRTCQSTGEWSGPSPECRVVTCLEPPVPVNGRRLYNSLDYNSVVQYSCNNNFKLHGESRATCTESAQWSTATPKCVAVKLYCEQPSQPLHTWPVTGQYGPGHTLQLQCIEGYQPTGNLDITCTRDLKWSAVTASCQRVYCGKPPKSSGVMIMGTNFHFGDQLKYTCRGRLRTSGDTVLTCLANGQWDKVPTCSATCKFPCKNGGTCIGRNTCKCLPGYSGRFCNTASCVLPCLNGGKCTAPYICECSYGYTGARCETPVCSRACENGGSCVKPNRCICLHGFKPPFCEL